MDGLEQNRSELDRVDREMAALFSRRMELVRGIAAYKQANGLPVADPAREAEILARSPDQMEEDFRIHYAAFQRCLLEISKDFQRTLRQNVPGVCLSLGQHSCDVLIERGGMHRVGDLFDLKRRVMIITDDGVPVRYAQTAAAQCSDAEILTITQGEASKNYDTLRMILERMIALDMTREDCVVSVGGGMVGDLAGLAASLYLRGVDFYNIPTTLLSQVDASVGGKTAIDFAGIKNSVGAFYQPRAVLIDPGMLSTLPRRQLSAGMAEALKMAVSLDSGLFAIFEQDDPFLHVEEIIGRCVKIKAAIVAADERDTGLRHVLNLGHTIGHAIESAYPPLLHGECVALGMLPMCSESVRARLLPIYRKLGLPPEYPLDLTRITAYMARDKKRTGAQLMTVEVPEIGRYRLCPSSVEDLAGRLSCIMRGV